MAPLLATDPTAPTLLAQLRAGTRQAHDRMEACPALSCLLAPGLTIAAYGVALRAMRAFHEGAAHCLDAAQAELPPGLGFDQSRLACLDADLAWLGAKPMAALRLGASARDVPSRLGLLYVLEGSALGGRVIGRAVAEMLGVSAGAGGSFFCGTEAGPARARWLEFCATLNQHGATLAPDERARAIAGANAAFDALGAGAAPCRAGSSGRRRHYPPPGVNRVFSAGLARPGHELKGPDMLESLVADKDNNYARLRTPGRIQGFGVMLALHPRTLRVLSASENTGTTLGLAHADLLGRALSEFAGPAASLTELRETAAEEYPVFNNPIPLQIGGSSFDAVLHAQDGLVIAELEALAPGAPGRDDLDRLNEAAIGGMMVPDTLETLMVAGPEAIRAATGFDRVMLYRFDEAYRGQVVGEARRPGVDSFLGLFFPEADIGPPARQLYEQNFCRYIPHITGATYRVLPAENPLTGRLLDMSQAVLRGVAPCHIEYLSNMGVAASMSYSIMSDGKLWGLFACHHHQPAQLSYVQRLVCEQIAMMFAAKLEEVINPAALMDDMERRRDAVLQASPICLPDPLAHDWTQAEEDALLALVEADGAAIYLDGRVGQIGSCPDLVALHDYIHDQPDRFARLLHMYDDAGLFYSNSIAGTVPFGDAMAEKGSGMMAIPLSAKGGQYLIWFRPELVVKASWGGNPSQPHGTDPYARFSPRRSFAAWREDIRNRAAPWSAAQIANAASLRDHMIGRGA